MLRTPTSDANAAAPETGGRQVEGLAFVEGLRGPVTGASCDVREGASQAGSEPGWVRGSRAGSPSW